MTQRKMRLAIGQWIADNLPGGGYVYGYVHWVRVGQYVYRLGTLEGWRDFADDWDFWRDEDERDPGYNPDDDNAEAFAEFLVSEPDILDLDRWDDWQVESYDDWDVDPVREGICLEFDNVDGME